MDKGTKPTTHHLSDSRPCVDIGCGGRLIQRHPMKFSLTATDTGATPMGSLTPMDPQHSQSFPQRCTPSFPQVGSATTGDMTEHLFDTALHPAAMVGYFASSTEVLVT